MELPADVLAAAVALTGEPYAAAALGGLSGATVAEVVGPAGRVVVKGPVGRAERHVTVVLAEPLLAHGVRLGRCLGVVERGDRSWLLLEHLPGAWPRERWGADPEALAVLRGLHAVDPGLLDGVPDRYRPTWDDRATEVAAGALGITIDRISDLQRRAAPLFVPVAVVSADPNPLNWRLDAVGRPALVDQGRLTLARPEVDLAILLPGLPSRAQAAAAVAAYGSGDVDLVLLAKLWSVVELTDTAADLVAGLADEVRRWSDEVLR